MLLRSLCAPSPLPLHSVSGAILDYCSVSIISWNIFMQNLLNLNKITLVMSVAVDVIAIYKPSVGQHFVQVTNANYPYKITNLELYFS